MTDVLTGRSGGGHLGRRTAPALDVRVLRGRSAVFALLPEFDVLARRLRQPVTARAPWLRAQLVADPLARPWAVCVRGADGRLRAAAVLLDDELDQRVAHAVLASGGRGYRGGIPAVDGAALAQLARGLAEDGELRSVAVRLATLPDGDETRALADALDARIEPEPPIPAVVVAADREMTSYLSHGMARTLRKARNRLAADDRKAEVEVTRNPADVTAAMPVMERAYRGRDREHGVACPLDTPVGLARWRERIRHLLDDRCLELATLTVDGELAAYALGVRDGPRYGVLEGHFDTAWSRYSPGRLLEASMLERALADPSVESFDWMTSVASDSLLAANATEAVVTLRHSPRGTTGTEPNGRTNTRTNTRTSTRADSQADSQAGTRSH